MFCWASLIFAWKIQKIRKIVTFSPCSRRSSGTRLELIVERGDRIVPSFDLLYGKKAGGQPAKETP